MNRWWQICRRGGKFCAHCAISLVCWTLWLGLSMLLVFQLYIAFAREMPVPGFLLRSLEQRLEASGLKVNFGRTTFDPTGQVLVENLQLVVPSFGEPVADVRAVYVQLDPWALLGGRFEPSRLRASGINLHIPAMLAESGASETLLSHGDLILIPLETGIAVPQFTAQVAGVNLSARGAIDLSSLPGAVGDENPLARFLTTHYARICRKLTTASQHLTGLRDGRVQLLLRPSPKLGAIANVSLSGSHYERAGAKPFTLGPFRADTRLPLWHQEPFFARITATLHQLDLPGGIHAEQVRTILRTRINNEKLEIKPRRADVTIGRLTAAGVTANAVSADLNFDRWPDLEVNALARIAAETVHVQGQVNPVAARASVQAAGRFDPALLSVISRRVGRDVRQFLDFGRAPEFDLHLNTGPGWTSPVIEGEVAARDVYAYRVTFDRIGGHVRVADGRFVATNASAAIGTNFATGSYEHDFATHDFRFLLTGRLHPLDISGWFRDWWDNFWNRFDFSAAAPGASVDVQGRWRDGARTSVFVFADGANPVINGTPLDHVTTLIYLRPNYYDAMQVLARRGEGKAEGWFVRRHDPATRELQRMDFDFKSTLDPATAANLVGPEVAAIVEPFVFTSPVEMSATGYIGTPSDYGPAKHIEVHGQTQGDFTFHRFPLTGLNFTATVNDDDILIEPLSAGFASGVTAGRMRIEGPEDARLLGFDLGLKQGNLQQASNILTTYFAQRRGTAAAEPGVYVQKNANVVIDLDVSAEGQLDDPMSFEGSGNAELSGRGLGEIRLLGLLSELLNFTSLRFNHLSTNFTVEKNKVVFPEVSVTGSSAAVTARGAYSLDRGELDFNARIYPFQESKFILKTVVGAVLTPLSNVLEVKLTGELAKPKWAFVIGPTNILRNLGQSDPAPPGTPAPNPSPVADPPAAPPPELPAGSP